MSNHQSPLSSFQEIKDRIAEVVVGQDALIDRLLLALVCNGHVLLEGVPGVAKTLTVSSLARAIHVQFSRIQFTPDLLPGDLTGTLVYDPKAHTFTPEKGPVFTNLLLADEINLLKECVANEITGAYGCDGSARGQWRWQWQ